MAESSAYADSPFVAQPSLQHDSGLAGNNARDHLHAHRNAEAAHRVAARRSAISDNGAASNDAAPRDASVSSAVDDAFFAEAEGLAAPAEEDVATNEAAARLRNGRLGYRFVKRLFDIMFSMLVLALFSWLYVVVAIAIKADDPEGPVFFVQERVGRDGKPFQMFKFRSMFADAEERLAELKDQNEKDGPVFKMRNDPRITRVGRFIRKTSIDELPQFLNVLLGNMSVVGPRPALPREVAAYTPRQRQRLLVKPGITCFWQTRRNRDSITFDEWIALDLLYIQQCSVWTDFKQIVETVGVVLTAQGS